MKSWDIVGYTYQAEVLCSHCVQQIEWKREKSTTSIVLDGTDTETCLDMVARMYGIDRYDETSYDSSEFPKVIFASDIEDSEHCGQCGSFFLTPAC